MKLLSVILLVITASQLAIGAGAKNNAPKTVAEMTKKYKLDRETVNRTEKSTQAARVANIRTAAPELSRLMGSSLENIIKVLTYNGHMIDMVVKAAETSDQNFKDLVSKLVDLYAAKIDQDITLLDINSSESKQMSKLSILLALDKVEKQYLEFANEVATKISEGGTFKMAMESVAAKYAAKKGMTVAEWLKKLEDCLA